MILETYIPTAPLNQFVESFVYYRDYSPTHSIDRFLPDGNVYVVIDLTDYPKYIYDNNTLKEIQSCRNVWFSGIRTRYITIPSGRDSEMFIINFHKGKAYPFVEMPMHELTDYVVDGELVMSNEILDLRDAIQNLHSPAQKFHFAEQYLQRTFIHRLSANPCVEYAVEHILHAPGPASMRALTARIGYSQKHFIDLFKRHVGLTPKAFMRIMRFQRALLVLESRQNTDWTALAPGAGYFDQSHFINDFRLFSGFTPGHYLNADSEFTNYVAVG